MKKFLLIVVLYLVSTAQGAPVPLSNNVTSEDLFGCWEWRTGSDTLCGVIFLRADGTMVEWTWGDSLSEVFERKGFWEFNGSKRMRIFGGTTQDQWAFEFSLSLRGHKRVGGEVCTMKFDLYNNGFDSWVWDNLVFQRP